MRPPRLPRRPRLPRCAGRTSLPRRTGAARSSASDVLRAVLDYGPVASQLGGPAGRAEPGRGGAASPGTRLTRAGLLREAPEAAGGLKGGGPPARAGGRCITYLLVWLLRPAHRVLQHATLALVDLRGRVVARGSASCTRAPGPRSRSWGRVARRVPAVRGRARGRAGSRWGWA